MKEFTLKFSEEKIQILSKALMNMKHKHVAALINDINLQLAAQAQAQNQTPIPNFVGDVQPGDPA